MAWDTSSEVRKDFQNARKCGENARLQAKWLGFERSLHIIQRNVSDIINIKFQNSSIRR
jgi:hypothetical protein